MCRVCPAGKAAWEGTAWGGWCGCGREWRGRGTCRPPCPLLLLRRPPARRSGPARGLSPVSPVARLAGAVASASRAPSLLSSAAAAAPGETCRENPITGPRAVTTRKSQAPLPRRGPAADTMSPVLGRPPDVLRSGPVNPGAQTPGAGRGPTARGKQTSARRATRPDEAPRTRRGPEARQRGTPLARIKAHRRVPSNNGHQMPQTRTARTTSNQPRHENRCQTTPAAVWMDVCIAGSKPSPCRL